MSKKFIVAAALGIFGVSQMASAQTNLQAFYDFSREHFTTTLEGYYGDSWGDTFFFIDYDYNQKGTNGNNVDKHVGVSGSYFEIARGINFWKESKLKDLSAHVEYNGGVGFGNQNFLFGANYFIHNKDFSNCFTFELMYKTFNNGASSDCPLQFTFVWGMQDLFGVKGLRFSGFADVWGENTNYWFGDKNPLAADPGKVIFLSEPQLWYNIGQFMGLKDWSIGTEIELSYNFAGCSGFYCRPCIGTKWVF